ncbi:hypothetical protein F5B18DRAFT_263300 [Nemania serpens]|nr:hypothetical protein F5B18DRAFT_263300 [Nemania serpens]
MLRTHRQHSRTGAQVHIQTPTQAGRHTHRQADRGRERGRTNRETEITVAVLSSACRSSSSRLRPCPCIVLPLAPSFSFALLSRPGSPSNELDRWLRMAGGDNGYDDVTIAQREGRRGETPQERDTRKMTVNRHQLHVGLNKKGAWRRGIGFKYYSIPDVWVSLDVSRWSRF